MPLYEYRCSKCNNLFQLMEKISALNESRKCPKCGGDSKKIISLSSFHLKGGGWYVTDYKGKSNGNSANKESACSAASSESPKCASCPASETK
ncbi:zinc ribbon domain-containing protein [Deferribacterales bacterium Es71-Z0220]|uniref:FmdB family zinc ribbon protein n=1 Tax=Deferrivibrio essentukiensis TaxID=2880922 RepID=UPI001F618186|nr:zinc ribbon domain-containing protein [Deferrivibrio essentukiensis]MCB4204045.1 zinc ribbon domain-containing protein [Deferrivibrio essentukiensis]